MILQFIESILIYLHIDDILNYTNHLINSHIEKYGFPGFIDLFVFIGLGFFILLIIIATIQVLYDRHGNHIWQ